MSQEFSRRQFIPTAAAALGFASSLEAQRAGTPITPVLSDPKYALKDQLGKPFGASKILQGKPYLIIYGYQGCPLCNTSITPTIAEVQKQMRDAGVEVPIVVVTIKPEEDIKTADSYQQRYESKGVFPFKANEKVTALSKNAGANEIEALQKKRMLHILFAKNDQASVEMHYAIGATRIGNNDKSHTVMLTLVGADGKATQTSIMAAERNSERRKEKAAKMVGAVKQEMQKALSRP